MESPNQKSLLAESLDFVIFISTLIIVFSFLYYTKSNFVSWESLYLDPYELTIPLRYPTAPALIVGVVVTCMYIIINTILILKKGNSLGYLLLSKYKFPIDNPESLKRKIKDKIIRIVFYFVVISSQYLFIFYNTLYT